MCRFGPRRIGKEIGHSRNDTKSSWSSNTSRDSGTWKKERHLREREEQIRLDEELTRQEQARLDHEALTKREREQEEQILLDEELSRREQARLKREDFVEQEREREEKVSLDREALFKGRRLLNLVRERGKSPSEGPMASC